jgi:hypothetical protein
MHGIDPDPINELNDWLDMALYVMAWVIAGAIAVVCGFAIFGG